jgi:hypothetical protein
MLLVMHIQPVGRIKKESHANLGMFLNGKVNNQMGTQKWESCFAYKTIGFFKKIVVVVFFFFFGFKK